MPIPIILDCDPGHDDAIALLLALGSSELELLGVTTTYGNQTLEKTTANALRVLELAGRADVPVACGAAEPLEREVVVAAHVHGESGLDGPTLPPPSAEPISTDAVAWIADAIGRSPSPVTLIPTGPLTNIAAYLRAHGTAGIDRIVLMGGAIAEGNMTPAAEFNIWADPEAAQIVFDAELDVTMIGLDVTHKAVTGPDVQNRLRDAGSVGVFVAELVDFFTVYHRQTYGWDERRSTTRSRSRTSSARGWSRRSSATSRWSSPPTSVAAEPLSTCGSARAGPRTPTSASISTRMPSSTCSSSAWGGCSVFARQDPLRQKLGIATATAGAFRDVPRRRRGSSSSIRLLPNPAWRAST